MGTTRVCFRLTIDPAKLTEYVRRHRDVWPEMLDEIAASGRRNYSIYLADDGTLIGYYETNDDEAASAYLASSPIAAKWEAEMSSFFVDLTGRPDQGSVRLVEIFNLDEQIAARPEGLEPTRRAESGLEAPRTAF
jgi:L-rhamnose mutarotase